MPRGDEVVPVANRLIARFERVLATRDWHPPNHGSFASRHPGRRVGEVIDLNGLPQVLWPDHCIERTPGADFAPGLATRSIAKEFLKGTDPGIDSYSGFFDNGHRQATGLGDYLAREGVREVYLVGLATDYCVQFTALDARRLGLGTAVILEGVRGVDLEPGDGDRALAAMEAAGVRLLHEAEVAE